MRTCVQRGSNRDAVRSGAGATGRVPNRGSPRLGARAQMRQIAIGSPRHASPVLLILVAIAVGAGCATSSRRGGPAGTPGAEPAQGPASIVAPPSNAGSGPPNNAAKEPARANDDSPLPGDSVFEELEAELAQKQVFVADPLEPVNRLLFGFNDVVYFWVLKPVAQAYAGLVPKPARTGVRNFFHNLATPARLVNCILQGKNAGADIELQRFAINTTVGVLGLGDPARDRWGLKPVEEDLGQTLAVYGLGDGFYLVWPLLGPSTLRDSAGMVGDAFLDPVRYVEPEAVSIGISVADTVNSTSLRLGEYESLKAATVDPYVAMRDAYVQYRRKQIREEMPPPSSSAADQMK